MRHRVKKHTLGRKKAHRQAMLRNLIMQLVEHGQITTSKAKAKEVKRLVDKLVYQAQQNTVASRRQLHKFFGKRQVVNRLVEEVAPALSDRVSGFTTLKTVGKRRGDNTLLATIKFVKDVNQKGAAAS
jgi:large subunit ribosomal protein L17